MPTCFSKDECDVIDSGNYIWRQPEKLSPDVPTFLLSIHPCFSLAFLLHRILVHGNRFSLSGSTFKSSQNHLHKRPPHFIPPHCWQSCASTIHTFFIEPTKNISSWWIDSLLPSSPSKTRCARLLGICSQKKHTHHPRPRYAIRAASTHSRPQLTNGVP